MGEEGNKRAGSPGGKDAATKKARIEDARNTEEVFVKVLIPMAAAGAVIGKGGEAMRKLHEETGCKVKMSKSTDIFPGTNERVAIIHGQINAAMTVMKHFMGKIRQNEASLEYEERVKEPLLQSYRQGHSRYQSFLEEQKKADADKQKIASEKKEAQKKKQQAEARKRQLQEELALQESIIAQESKKLKRA